MEGNVTLKVDPEVLISKASEFDSTRTQLMALIEEMRSKVASLNASWTGETADTFREKFAQLDDDIEYINGRIIEHVSDLNEIAEVYRNSGNANTTTASGLPTDTLK